MKIGFIGIGNMGSAMLKGAIEKFGMDNLCYTDINETLCQKIEAETSIAFFASNAQVVKEADAVVLAVKPQYLEGVLEEISSVVKRDQIMISIAPGVTIEYIKEQLGSNIRVVRSMPNTPALVLEAMSCYCLSQDTFSSDEKVSIVSFFESFGRAVEVKEYQLDMVVPVSGSSPAYFFIMLEAMADAAVLTGLPRDISYELAAQSMLGAAKMVIETKSHPGVLKDAVCSPGGTTIEAVKVLEATGFRSSIIESMVACYDKTQKFK